MIYSDSMVNTAARKISKAEFWALADAAGDVTFDYSQGCWRSLPEALAAEIP
jgi:hypothetical protein